MTTQKPWSDHIVESVCLAFALWTLCCQAVVAGGGNLYALLAVFAVAGTGALVAAWKLRPTTDESLVMAQPPLKPSEVSAWETIQRLRLVGAALAVVGVLLIFRTGDMTALWWWITGCLSVAFAAAFFGEEPALVAPAAGHRREMLLWVLAFVAIAFTLFAHRSDYDDSLYVNFAVATADYPGEPLLAKDTLHGIEGLPLSLMIYRLQSWELLIGAFSWLTSISAIRSFHMVAAAVAALLAPLAWARLFRLLVPRRWPWAVLALFVVLVAAGETHRWYGNFAFVRIWQGKSLLVTVFLPLVAAFALEYAARPSRRRWLFLCAVQIAAVGANVTAIWAAPAVALAGIVCGMQPTWRGLRSAAAGALGSLYILASGALTKRDVSAFVVPEDAPFDFGKRGDLLRGALVEVLGDSRLLLCSLVAIALAWALTPPGLGRRYAAGLPLAVWVVLLNPYTAPLIFKQVTGPAYWRVLWSLPIPILIALVLISPLHLAGRHGRRGLALTLAFISGYALFVPKYSGFSSENRVLMKMRPTLKVRWPMYRMAGHLNASVPKGSYLLAPDEVSMWIPTLHDHSFPIRARHYLNLNRFYLGENDFEQRGAMMRYVAGTGEDGDVELFCEGLERFDVEAVCLWASEDAEVARSILEAARFLKTGGDERYEIWVRQRRMIYIEGPHVFKDGFENGDLSSWSLESYDAGAVAPK